MSKFWRHFLSNGLSRRIERRLGLFGHPAGIPACLQRHLGLGAESGFLVRLVRANSPAQQAGLVEEDVILTIGERAVRETAGLHALLGKLPAELPLPIVFLRGGRRIERWVVLNDLPDRKPTQAG